MIFLILYWLIFFRKTILNPFLLSTSELLSNFFPTLHLAGEYWIKGKLPKDPYFYPDIIAVAHTGILYPTNIFLSIIMQFVSLNTGFTLMVYDLLLHFLLMSIGGYVLFGGGTLGLLGGLLFGYSGYMVKQQPCILHTISWLPWALAFKGWFLPSICLTLAILGGYLPLCIYFSYFFVIINPMAVLGGIILASPFLYRVWRYYKKSVKSSENISDKMSIGTVPKWKVLNFFLPLNLRHYINGAGFWEMSFYMSPVILFSFLHTNVWWIWVLISGVFLFSQKAFRAFGFLMSRIPARWGYMLTVGLIFTTISGISQFSLNIQYIALGITAVCLLENSNLIPIWPFSQAQVKPDKAFEAYTGKWPSEQGQIHHIKTEGYKGCFRLK